LRLARPEVVAAKIAPQAEQILRGTLFFWTALGISSAKQSTLEKKNDAPQKKKISRARKKKSGEQRCR